jgi:hypothetical protein
LKRSSSMHSTNSGVLGTSASSSECSMDADEL